MKRTTDETKKLRGQRLKELMQEQGLTQKELAERIGKAQNTVSRLINGKHELTEVLANIIAEAFPPYNSRWLLGESRHKTIEIVDIDTKFDVDNRIKAMVAYMNGRGYFVDKLDAQDSFPTIDDQRQTRFESGYTFRKGREVVEMDANETIEAARKISEFVDLVMQTMKKSDH